MREAPPQAPAVHRRQAATPHGRGPRHGGSEQPAARTGGDGPAAAGPAASTGPARQGCVAYSRRFCEPRACRGALVPFYSEFAPRTPEGSGSPGSVLSGSAPRTPEGSGSPGSVLSGSAPRTPERSGSPGSVLSGSAPRTPERSGSPNPNCEDKKCGRRAGATPRAAVGGQGGPASAGSSPDRVTVGRGRGNGGGSGGRGRLARALCRGGGAAGGGAARPPASGSQDFTPIQVLSGSSCPHGIWRPSSEGGGHADLGVPEEHAHPFPHGGAPERALSTDVDSV